MESSCSNDQIEEGEYPFYNSSLLMFVEIKKAISRCTSFSNTKTFLDLHTSIKNVLRYYSKLLKRTVPALSQNQTQTLEEVDEVNLVYIINTCEYCNGILPALDEHIKNEIEESYKDKVDLETSQEVFRVLINACIQCLINSFEVKIKEQYSEMSKMNWEKFKSVEDNLKCIKNVKNMLKSISKVIEPAMNSTYYSYFMNKLGPSIPKLFMEAIYKIKKCNGEASQQFQLDILELKSCLIDVAKSSDKISKTFINLVNKTVAQSETRLKVIGMPKEQICEMYNHIVTDTNKSIDDFDKLVKIRGFNKAEFDLSQIIVEVQ